MLHPLAVIQQHYYLLKGASMVCITLQCNKDDAKEKNGQLFSESDILGDICYD